MAYITEILVYAVFAPAVLAGLLGLWALPRRPALPVGIVAFGTALVVLAASGLADGIYFSADTYLGDLWTGFEAINKIAGGVRANLDYYSPVGPAFEWVLAAAVALGEPSAATLPRASALLGSLVLLLSVLALRRRLSFAGVAVVSLVAVTAAVSPREVDVIVLDTQASFLAPYNRWGFALFVPAMALFAAPPPERPDPWGAAAAGVLIALMLLIKATYGVAALVMAGVAMVLRRQGTRDLAVAAVAAAAVLLAAHLATGQILPYLDDLRETANHQHSRVRPIKLLRQFGEVALVSLLTLLILYMLTARRGGEEEEGADGGALRPALLSWRFLQPALLLMAVAAAGWLVLMQNHSVTEASVYAILPLLAVAWAGAFGPAAGTMAPERLRVRNGLVALALLAALVRPLTDAGFVLAQQAILRDAERLTVFAGSPIDDLVIEPRLLADDPVCTSVCDDVRRLVEGRAMLRRHGVGEPGRGTVLALHFSNPFPMAMGLPSPPGAPIWTHLGRSITFEQHPPAEEMFRDVDFVLVSRSGYNGQAMAEMYERYLSARFRRVETGTYWELLVRRSSGAGS